MESNNKKTQEVNDWEELPVETQSVNDWEDIPEIPYKKETTIPSEVKGTLVGSAIGASPGATAEILGTITEKIAKARSPYTPEQLQTLSENYQALKNIEPAETMKKVGGQFIEQNRAINELEEQAYSKLTQPISRQEYQKSVVESSLPFTKQVPENTIEFLKTKEELTPKLQSFNPIEMQEAQQLEKFANKKASEIINNKRTASFGTIPEEQLLQEYSILKEQIKQTKEGFNFKPDLEKAMKTYRNQVEEEKSLKEEGRKSTVRKFETPLAENYPELKGRMYSSAYQTAEKDVLNILNKYKPGDRLTGSEAYKVVRDIRQAIFDKDGNLKIEKDIANAAVKNIRNLVGEKNPEASQLFQEMSRKIQDLEKLEDVGYLKRNKDISEASPEFIEFGEKQQKKIVQDIAPNLYKSGIDVSEDVTKRLSELKSALPDNLYKELELAVLKIAMEDPTKKATISNFDIALGMVAPKFVGSKYLGKLISSPKGSLQTFRLGRGLQKIAKPLAGVGAVAGGVLGGPLGAFAGEVAQEALDVEPSGALPTEVETEDRRNAPMPVNPQDLDRIKSTYWFEKGYTPEEQLQKARLASFKQGLPEAPSEIPSRFEAPEVRQRKEQVLAIKKAGALAPTYVEAPLKQVLKADNPAEISSIAQSMQASPDRASQEYSRVLSQIVDAPASQKEAVLFGLNQQPAFRDLVRKLKGK
jgi:hypothetical protein